MYNQIEIKNDIIERVLSHIRITDNSCWESTYAPKRDGYTRIKINEKDIAVHRLMFYYYNGELNTNLTINHKCENRVCCNPQHLEQVTQKQNKQYSYNIHGHPNSKKTHCPRGHEYSNKNLIINSKGSRLCKTCQKIHNSNKKEKHDCFV